MRDIAVHSRLLAAATAAIVIAAQPADAATRDGSTGITVIKVAVEAGRLIVEGTTPKAGQVVGLVNPKAAVRSARSGKSVRRFRISVPSTPANCRAGGSRGARGARWPCRTERRSRPQRNARRERSGRRQGRKGRQG